MMKRCLMLLILLLSPVLALGDIPPELVQRYAPLEGYVVDQVGDEFIVDLDAEDGLHVGDILTLEVPGR